MTHIITFKLLKELGAYNDWISYFTFEYGEEATLNEVLNNPGLEIAFAAWLGRNLPAEFMTWDERLALQLDDRDFGPDRSAKEVEYARRQFDDELRARFARQCPKGTAGATFEKRLALQLAPWAQYFIIDNFTGES